MPELAPFVFALVLIMVTTFLYAMNRRWLSRVPRGFFYTLLVALAGAGASTAVLLGTWGYESARIIVIEQRIYQLQSASEIVGRQITDGLQDVFKQLDKIAAHLSAHPNSELREKERQELENLDEFSGDILSIHVIDASGKVVLNTGRKDNAPPPSAHTLQEVLQGRLFVSEPRWIPAFNRYALELCLPAKSIEGRVSGALCVRYDVQSFLRTVLHAIHFGSSGYVTVADSTGHVIAHPDAARIGDDISAYPAVQAALTNQSGWSMQANKAGQRRLMLYLPLRVINAARGAPPWIMLAEMDMGEALEPVDALLLRFVGITVLVILGSVLIALQISRSLRRPMTDLLDAVRAVEKGDLSARSHLDGRDELGLLATSFNSMVAGLQERERIKDLFGRYVTTQVSEQVLAGQLNVDGEKRHLTVLFSDIRNFTTMSEKMPPEDVVTFLNAYFTDMVDAVFAEGGILDKFIGDGMLAEFGAFGDQPAHAAKAVRAALRMKASLQRLNAEREADGEAAIAIGIGIHTDDVIVGNIGSKKRLDYTVIGDGVNTASRVESLNKQFGTTILITQNTHDELPPGEFECRRMPVAELKGKSQKLTFYEVVGHAR